MKSYSDYKPERLERVGNGSCLYRWNISTAEDGGYQYDEATVWQPITANGITEAVISELWNIDIEQKLINEYNAAQMGIYDDLTARAKIEAYTAFLKARKSVKDDVDAFCKERGIR